MFSGVTKMIGIFGNFQVNISGYTVTNIRVRDLTEGHRRARALDQAIQLRVVRLLKLT